jgi:hypothetical protein
VGGDNAFGSDRSWNLIFQVRGQQAFTVLSNDSEKAAFQIHVDNRTPVYLLPKGQGHLRNW